MNILVAHDTSQTGLDPFVAAMVGEIEKRFGAQAKATHLLINDLNHSMEKEPIEWDVIVLVNANRWYQQNRIFIKGSPWVCSCSFTFDDLVDLTRQPLTGELGLNCLFTNCSEYVKHVATTVPLAFSWKPIYKTPSLDRNTLFGTTLFNVLDRDFSLLLLAKKYLEKKGKADKFRIYMSDNLDMELPEDLDKYVVKTSSKDVMLMYSDIQYYIPVPRVLDYRGGVLPPEYIQAVCSGCKPLLISHSLLKRQDTLAKPVFKSIEAIRSAIDAILNGDDVITPLPPEYPDMCPTSDDLADKIHTAHCRWKANATA